MQTFGERLNYLRKSVNITADSLANAVGIKRRIIFLYEKNEAKPSYDVLVSLSNYFGVSLDYLTGRSNNPQYEEYIDKAEAELLNEAENLMLYGTNAEVNSKNELLGSVGGFIKGFYSSYRLKYTAPLARLRLIFATRKFADQHLNPKTIQVHLITPKPLRRASLLSPKAFLRERGFIPEEVLDIKSLNAGEKTDIQLLVEELDKLEEDYKRSTPRPNDN